MKQVKMFCGRSLSLEENINSWLKENDNNNILDIKLSKGDSFIYALLIYEDKNQDLNYPGLNTKGSFNL